MTTAPHIDTDGSDEGTRAEMPVLAVDLDGTLLRSDMLHETLWGALAVRSRMLGPAIRALFRGRAALKARLADNVTIDPETLPYDQRVLDRIAAWRAKGGYVVLVTATDVRLARKVADHLGVFDAVHGSTAERNLKGAEKTALLVAEYGREGLRLYRRQPGRSGRLVRGGGGHHGGRRPHRAPRRRRHGSAGRAYPRTRRRSLSMIRAMRPHQWLKNLLVFVPIIADPAHGGWEWSWALAAFVALSLAASAGYIINDLLDLADDRTHPRKRNRPFARGDLSVATGTRMVPVLLLLSLGVAALISRQLVAVVVIYFILTMAYSLG
jgi:hypothetical protein